MKKRKLSPSIPLTRSIPQSDATETRLAGIGSSAGGLEALRELLECLPQTATMCYVIAQHVSPTHTSLLAGLLASSTTLRVKDLEDNWVPDAGVVCIVPPNKDVILEHGRLRLIEPQSAMGPKPSVNLFFGSLAAELGDQAIGIILSGTGSDGAAGIRAIRTAGGITIVQEPATAKYDGMPREAIHTGSVDLILPPKKIGPALERLLSEPMALVQGDDGGEEADELDQINTLVRRTTSFKLSDYKPTTVKRRIARRMNIVGCKTLGDYVDFLKANSGEAQSLMRDTFISVTAFFRDPEAFQVLEHVIDGIVRNRDEGEIIRCWVPGCATGEEVYSIAFLFEEALAQQGKAGLQYLIFASDLDEDALEQARSALYPAGVLEGIPRDFRDRYMTLNGGHYRVNKSVRSRIVFTRQNVVDDPPFGRLDLISCRNLLIYLLQPVQKRVLEMFRYALSAGGYLFLGKSETVDEKSGLFREVDRRARVYQPVEGTPHYQLPSTFGQVGLTGIKAAARLSLTTTVDRVSQRILDALVMRYAPPSVVINGDDDVVHMHGNLKPYLSFPRGAVSMHLFNLLEPPLRTELRALIYRCRRERQPLRGTSHQFELEGSPHRVTPAVSALDDAEGAMVMVSFDARPLEDEARASVSDITDGDRNNVIIAELEQELANTRTHLNVVVEELQSTNEELQSTNEELQSANEELQSANEELQTSNEELQSTNEELLTVNEEMHVKSAQLEALAGLLNNVKESLSFPMLVVDAQMCVTVANGACGTLIETLGPLEGLSLNSLSWQVEIQGLAAQVGQVIQEGGIHLRIVRRGTEAVFRLNIMPYRLEGGGITGAVLLFEDITAQTRSEFHYRQLTESLPLLVWTCAPEGPCDYLSPQWVAYTGKSEAEQLGFGWLEQIHPDERQRTIDHWIATAGQGLPFAIEFRVRRHDGAYRWFKTLAMPLRNEAGAIVKWFGTNTDIDDIKQADAERQSLLQRLSLATAAANIAVWVWDLASQTHTWDARMLALYQVPAEVMATGIDYAFWRSRCHPDDLEQADRAMNDALNAGASLECEFRILLPDGSVRHIYAAAVIERDADGAPIRVIGINHDISTLKRNELALRESEARLSMAIDVMPEALMVVDEQGIICRSNQRAVAIFGHEPQVLVGQPVEMLMPERIRVQHVGMRLHFNAHAELRAMGAGRRLYALHADGHEFPVEVALSPFLDGESRKVVVSVTDITERKRIELELQEHRLNLEKLVRQRTLELATKERFVRSLVSNLPGMVGYWDDTLHCRFANTAYRDWFGRSEAEMLGLHMQTALGQAYFQENERYIRAALEGQKQTFERSITKPSGEVGHLLAHYLPDIADGKVQGFVALVHDVTALKQHELELAKAKEKAESATSAKSIFLANMSHEIRTPMNAVLGLAYVLSKMDLPVEAHDLAQKIHASGQSLLGLLNDILDFSKMEAGKAEIEQAPIYLGDIFDNLATIMSAAAEGKGLELSISPPPASACYLIGDSLRIGQILINLTSNAIKFTERGAVTVKVVVVAETEQQASLRFIVRDTGIGMDAAAQEKLFSAFSQADASTTRRFGGTGLGLAISRRLVELMGGELQLESSPGLGSRFSFCLSLPKQASAKANMNALRALKLLVADDNPIALEGLGATLRSVGWEPELFESGEALWQRLLEATDLQSPDTVLLLDWQMPGLDGLQIVSRIHAHLEDGHRPLSLIVTAHGASSLAEMPDAALADGILTKPLGPSTLYNAIQQARHRRLGLATLRDTPGEKRLAGLRLLAVDDSEINLEVASRIFGDEGATVRTAANGQEAIDRLLSQPQSIDVVLMDVHMPVMDGLEATRRIRQNPTIAHLPILALTAGALKEQQEHIYTAGMNGFITKPFR